MAYVDEDDNYYGGDECWLMAYNLCWHNSMIAEMGRKILFIMPYFSSTKLHVSQSET